MSSVTMVQNSTEDGLESARSSDSRCDPDLWNFCAGELIQMPEMNSKVYYFPQGHAEHVKGNADIGNIKIEPVILCSMSDIKYLVDSEDEVYAKIRLDPLPGYYLEDNEYIGSNRFDIEKPEHSVKKLTQSDANNGTGFSVPKQCADRIFPRLDFSLKSPAQNIFMKDVHGKEWKFRHIYGGSPPRHLLTTGWTNFVNSKKLVAGDFVVFMKASNGDVHVGIRRAKRGIGGGLRYFSSSNAIEGNIQHTFQGYSRILREIWNGNANGNLDGRVTPECFVEAATLAARRHSFEVVYYPRVKIPAFFVEASAFRKAMQIYWFPGMRIKMALETDNSSYMSWSMGTISAVRGPDPVHWPHSPWRLLQVKWDEPDRLQHIKSVSPWSVEVASSLSPTDFLSFSPMKKMCFSQPQYLSLYSSFQQSIFSSNVWLSRPIFYPPSNFPVGIQEARHAQFEQPLRDIRLSGSSSSSSQLVGNTAGYPNVAVGNTSSSSFETDNESRLLNVENPNKTLKRKGEFRLFGQVIHSEDHSGIRLNGPIHVSPPEELSCNKEQRNAENVQTYQCKLFMDKNYVGHTLDLSVFGSCEELYTKLADILGIGSSEIVNNLLYQDESGAVSRAGEENFNELKTAKRLTVIRGAGGDNAGTTSE